MKPKKYHSYIYDFKNESFIGDFEKMYDAEKKLHFDSWFQEDQRHLKRQINKDILELFNFELIVDIGCGKGSFTHIFKKSNNEVIGIDISRTAIKTAQERYPDINFQVRDITDCGFLKTFEKKNNLLMLIEVLSYLMNWKEILNVASKHFLYVLINLYLPPNPIGYIKSENELFNEIMNYYDILFDISIRNKNQLILFIKSK
jgi:SAM-dependent methyltransferase